MSNLNKYLSLVEESFDYKDLHLKLKSSESELVSSGLDSVTYAQFVGFNIRLERLISVIIDSGMESSDSFEQWKADWKKTFISNENLSK